MSPPPTPTPPPSSATSTSAPTPPCAKASKPSPAGTNNTTANNSPQTNPILHRHRQPHRLAQILNLVILGMNNDKHIGIATFFDDNFGTCLQAYALQTVLNKLGYKSEIIRYYRGSKNIKTESRWKKLFRYSPSIVWKYLTQRAIIERKRAAFIKFRAANMTFSPEAYYRDSDLKALENKYSAFVCGSDMIWSEDFQDDWSFLYLSFAPKMRCVAYAPSFGKNHLSKENIKVCTSYINNIGHLSCRESAGVELIKRSFGLEATHVMDPTLLLSAEEWGNAISRKNRLVEKPYNLVYCFLGTKNGREDIFEQIKLQKDRELVFLSGADGNYKKYMYKNEAGPFEFVQMYRDAEFVITDTFHGMLFAIIFRKPFVVLAKEPFGISADRLKFTLSSLGLEDRYIQYETIIDEKYLNLDYTSVIPKLKALTISSLDYLKQSLAVATNNE